MANARPIRRIVKRDGSIVRYDRRRIANAVLKAMAAGGCAAPRRAAHLAAQVERALVQAYGRSATPTVEDIQDVVENVLMDNRLADVARRYIIYRHEHAMARASRAYDFAVSDVVPYRKLYEALRWNVEHGCDSVQALNRLVRRGGFPDVVREADRRYEAELGLAAARLASGRGRIRVVIVAGPSSSGKSTTTIKLGEILRRSGFAFRSLVLDNYFYDLDRHPRDEFGDHDYETPAALDLDMVNDHLGALLAGRRVRVPHYDFKTGRRRLLAREMRLGRREILLIDSLHGLHERTTAAVPAERKFRLYVETLGQVRAADGTFMRWSDNRLLRRMVRDKDHRNLKPMRTLTHWHYVRRSEMRYIIPFIKHADCIVNTALPYELPVLRRRLFAAVARGVSRYARDAARLDAHIRVNRLYDLLKPLHSVPDERAIPRDSLLREFIGGSSYTY